MKKRILALFVCLIVIIAALAVPTFADETIPYLDEGEEPELGVLYEANNGIYYSAPQKDDMTEIVWTGGENGMSSQYQLLGSDCGYSSQGTQYLYMRAPKDSDGLTTIRGPIFVFEDVGMGAYVYKAYSVRFQWWINSAGNLRTDIIITNDTTEGAELYKNILMRYESGSGTNSGWWLYDYDTNTKIVELTGYIKMYYKPQWIYGLTTYSNGTDDYGMNNFYHCLGEYKLTNYIDYNQGYDAGYDLGWQNGYYDGNAVGYKSGYDIGYVSGYDVGYEKGHDNGYIEGTDDGYYSGYIKGESYGKELGKTEALNMQSTLKNLIFSIFDAPFYVISSSLNFDLFGINIAGTLIALISTALIVWILKIIIVKLF